MMQIAARAEYVASDTLPAMLAQSLASPAPCLGLVAPNDGAAWNAASAGRHLPGQVACPARALVHVLDEDRYLPELISRLLGLAGFETRSHGSIRAFLNATPPDVASCLIADLSVAQASLPIADQKLAACGIDIPVLLAAREASIPMAVQAMKAGAADFIEKPFREQRLVEAIAAAVRLDGRRRAAEARRRPLLARYQTLTTREREVMAHVTAGKMNKQVAWELGLSEITVKVHRGSVMRKMDARTLADLVRMADTIAESPSLDDVGRP